MLVDLKLKDFVAELASNSPAPGGGSVAALSASLGASLISMLANLTAGKKGYEEYHDEMSRLAAEAESAGKKFLAVTDEDTKAFDVYMEAIRLPKDTDEQKAVRSAAMQRAAEVAAEVPLRLAQDAFNMLPKAEYAVRHGNKNATSDGAVAVMMLRNAVLAAIYNVRINLTSIKNAGFVGRAAAECDRLETAVKAEESRILAGVVF